MDAEIPTEDQLGDMYDAAVEFDAEERQNRIGNSEKRDIRVTDVMASSNKRARQYRKMTEAICEMLTDMGLVSFLPLNIQDGQVSGLRHLMIVS
jgi:hypothetical protein